MVRPFVASYVNNYQCGGGDCEGGVGSPQYNRVMNSTVQWLKQNGFEYLKVDSGGCYNDMELWHELLVAANWDITVENCHQGGQPPNATWCPFDLWRVGPDVNGIGPDNEIARVIAALNGMLSGCVIPCHASSIVVARGSKPPAGVSKQVRFPALAVDRTQIS